MVIKIFQDRYYSYLIENVKPKELSNLPKSTQTVIVL